MTAPAQQSCPNKGDQTKLHRILAGMAHRQGGLYVNAIAIAEAAEQMRQTRKAEFAFLPFCSTVEAQALGADVLPLDDCSGPRPGNYRYAAPDALTPADIATSPQVAKLLEAGALLCAQGVPVVYEISGPLSILNCLMDLSGLFCFWRKNGAEMKHVFALFEKMLLDYMTVVCRAGVAAISFADPAGNPQILGPRFSARLTEEFTMPFLQKALALCDEYGVRLILCPMLARGMAAANVLHPAPAEKARITVCCAATICKNTHKNYCLDGATC